jgi:hypothetical protein
MKLAALAFVLVAACGGGSDSDSDWTQKPIETVSIEVNGTKLTIDLPKGMRQTPESGGVTFDFHVGGYVKTPGISIREGALDATLDDYIKGEPKVDPWLRKDTLPDGYIATYENTAYKGKEDYLVFVQRTLGDKVFRCSLRVTPWSRGAKVKDKLPLAEKICLSLKRV